MNCDLVDNKYAISPAVSRENYSVAVLLCCRAAVDVLMEPRGEFALRVSCPCSFSVSVVHVGYLTFEL
jgi:hypothetical protein